MSCGNSLWGDCGQTALESSHVCLINATSLGTEILKSLVLPGIRALTIIDNKVVTEEELKSFVSGLQSLTSSLTLDYNYLKPCFHSSDLRLVK